MSHVLKIRHPELVSTIERVESPNQHGSRSVGHAVFFVYVRLPETLALSPSSLVDSCSSLRINVRIIDL
jgi:hypothetical protein